MSTRIHFSIFILSPFKEMHPAYLETCGTVYDSSKNQNAKNDDENCFPVAGLFIKGHCKKKSK